MNPMEYVLDGILWLLAIVFVGLTVLAIIYSIKERRQFKRGHNPFTRICKSCGAHQDQYRSNVEGWEHHTWWVEMSPVGNDPNCKCHSYADNERNW